MARWTRRLFLQQSTAAFAALTTANNALCTTTAAPLAPTTFVPLPLGQIRPAGWLKCQLRLQADGLGGHLDEFWPDVGPNSGWLGGTGESWERGPYFVDGLLPLAWQLNDAKLKSKAMRFVDWTLDHQAPNGMIGPKSNDDWWPRMVMCKVLTQYGDATGDPRVVTVLTRYFHYQLAALQSRPLVKWGRYRWQDEVLAIEWLYERTGDADLLRLAHLLRQQGYDWIGGFAPFRHTGVTSRARLDAAAAHGDISERMETHGVNNGQALKTAAVLYRLSGDLAAGWKQFGHQLEMLDRYHGQPNGMFSCDEHLAGLEPSHGTELCTVVETLFSLEVALAAFGDAAIADRVEKIAYNALPGTFDDSMWAHQYDQQANQIQVGLLSKPWTTNGLESNLFGLEPNFGCCTANFHQGWPKFTANLWMHSQDGGLAACLYAPCEIQTTVAGRKISLHVETDYPFRQDIQIVLTPETSLRFPLRLRVPGWASDAKVSVNGTPIEVALVPGTFALLDRTWSPGDVVDLQVQMKPLVSRGHNAAVTLSRGPIVFSLDPGESWVKLQDRGPTADWQVFPKRAWNYGLRVNEHTASKVEVTESPLSAHPFTAATPPVRLLVAGRLLDQWREQDGFVASVPEPIRESATLDDMMELIPYGCAKLRVTAFPEIMEA